MIYTHISRLWDTGRRLYREIILLMLLQAHLLHQACDPTPSLLCPDPTAATPLLAHSSQTGTTRSGSQLSCKKMCSLQHWAGPNLSCQTLGEWEKRVRERENVDYSTISSTYVVGRVFCRVKQLYSSSILDYLLNNNNKTVMETDVLELTDLWEV